MACGRSVFLPRTSIRRSLAIILFFFDQEQTLSLNLSLTCRRILLFVNMWGTPQDPGNKCP